MKFLLACVSIALAVLCLVIEASSLTTKSAVPYHRGATGATGETGATGATGAVGEPGASGATGYMGKTGDTGSTGPFGPVGYTGLFGAPGPLGNTGPRGLDGATGATGYVGMPGYQGPSGDKGDTGPPGMPGLPGVCLPGPNRSHDKCNSGGDIKEEPCGGSPRGQTVAVSVALISDYSVTGIVKFDTVLTNEGLGYDANTGIFTTPVNGTYVFTISAFGATNGQLILTKNGQPISGLSNEYHIFATSQTLHLTTSDVVSVRLTQAKLGSPPVLLGVDRDANGEQSLYHTTFTGIKL